MYGVLGVLDDNLASLHCKAACASQRKTEFRFNQEEGAGEAKRVVRTYATLPLNARSPLNMAVPVLAIYNPAFSLTKHNVTHTEYVLL